ncbi:MAG: hypothetical protein K2X38_17350 [Gemmataceae bacterium]|nr:hypothetical protein [Gemmataceae bacterium]
MRFGRCRRFLVFFLCGLTGCVSTRPCVDIKDYFKPGRLYANKVSPYGGVSRPQGPSLTPPGGGYVPSTAVPPPVPIVGGGPIGPPGPTPFAPFPTTPAPPSPGGNTTPPVFPIR